MWKTEVTKRQNGRAFCISFTVYARLLSAEKLSFEMTKRKIGAVCGAALLIAVAVVVAMRERQPALLMPEASVSQTPAEVRVKAVERKPEPLDHEVVEASTAVAIVCGADSATADRYEALRDADERTWLTDLIRRTAAFSGVKLMSYSVIMSNHFTYSSTSAVRRRCATRRS